jgi:hypothetical protein
MARSSQHCAIIYVSTDARHEEMQVETHNKPYFSMVFQDGSDFAPMARSEEEMKLALAEVTDVARDEWFVSAEVGSASRFHSLLRGPNRKGLFRIWKPRQSCILLANQRTVSFPDRRGSIHAIVANHGACSPGRGLLCSPAQSSGHVSDTQRSIDSIP